jgi:hypothetical protein
MIGPTHEVVPQQNVCMLMGKPDVVEQQSAQVLLADNREHEGL